MSLLDALITALISADGSRRRGLVVDTADEAWIHSRRGTTVDITTFLTTTTKTTTATTTTTSTRTTPIIHHRPPLGFQHRVTTTSTAKTEIQIFSVTAETNLTNQKTQKHSVVAYRVERRRFPLVDIVDSSLARS